MRITTHIQARIEWVQRQCCEYLEFTLDDLRCSSRSKSLVILRSVTVYVVKEVTGASYPEMAKMFCRDHSSLSVAYRRAQRMMTTDPVLAGHADTLVEKLRPAPVAARVKLRVVA